MPNCGRKRADGKRDATQIADGKRDATSYKDAGGLFSLAVPSGWLADTSGRQGTKVILLSVPSSGDFRANIAVTVQDLGTLQADEFLTLSRLQLRQTAAGGAIEEDQPVAGHPEGRLFQWTFAFGAFALRARQVVFIDGQTAYLATAVASAEHFDSYRADFEQALASFALTAPEPGRG